MKKWFSLILCTGLLLGCAACGESSSQTPPTLWVDKAENLPENFIMGADVSSLVSLENSGVTFYDFNGQEQDALKTMADAGINYIRVRVWNDPFDSQGNGYGGGNCTVDTAIALGKRAAKYGMGLLVDFHYSDFWADPAKQQAPKAWANMDMDTKTQAIYDFTVDSMNRFKEAGVKVGMVQIGNETTNGFCGEKGIANITRLMASAAKAVRDHDSNILIAVHYTNPEKGNLRSYAYYLATNGVDYDIFACSYYPFWHGTLENLTSQLKTISEEYGKKVMIAETSWAYTVEDTDMHGNSIGEQLTYDKPYPFTVQGQATAVSKVIGSMAGIGEAAVGVFYWEPAWISVGGATWEENSALWEQHGSGWASSYSKQYDPNDAGIYYGGSACDNQAMFDPEGHPLESLKVFSYVRTGTQVAETVDSVEPVYLTVKLNNPITLPETVDAVMNSGNIRPVAVTWDETADLAGISASPVGTYTVTGIADGKTVTCYIQMVEENYIVNYSFEDEDTSMWKLTHLAADPQADFQQKKTDAFSGEMSLHFWNADAVEFTAEQELTNLRPTTYRFSVQAQGGDVGEDAVMYIYVEADGQRYEQTFTVDGWCVWQNPVIENIVCESGTATVGVYIKTAGGGWGTLDDFLFNPQE